MNRPDDFARETRASSEGDVAPGLSSFVTEASMPAAASTAESTPPALWEFPAEGSHSAVAATAATGAAIRKAAMYASVAAAVGVGIAAGTWGARALQRSRPVATQMAAAPIVNAPVVTPPVDAPAEPSAELIPSVELRPSIGAPVARVVANPPQAAAVSQAVPDDRQPRDAAASTPRGTSGGTSAAARAMPAPRPRTEPVQPAVAPMATMNPAVTLPPPEAAARGRDARCRCAARAEDSCCDRSSRTRSAAIGSGAVRAERDSAHSGPISKRLPASRRPGGAGCMAVCGCACTGQGIRHPLQPGTGVRDLPVRYRGTSCDCSMPRKRNLHSKGRRQGTKSRAASVDVPPAQGGRGVEDRERASAAVSRHAETNRRTNNPAQ